MESFGRLQWRETDVGDDHVERDVGQQRLRLFPFLRALDLEADVGEVLARRKQQRSLVVDDEHASFHQGCGRTEAVSLQGKGGATRASAWNAGFGGVGALASSELQTIRLRFTLRRRSELLQLLVQRA